MCFKALHHQALCELSNLIYYTPQSLDFSHTHLVHPSSDICQAGPHLVTFELTSSLLDCSPSMAIQLFSWPPLDLTQMSPSV